MTTWYDTDALSLSQIYTAGEQGIAAKYGVSQTVAILGLTLFILGYGTGPSTSYTSRHQCVRHTLTGASRTLAHSVLLAASRDAASWPQPRLLDRPLPLHHLSDPHRLAEEPHLPPDLPFPYRFRWLADSRYRRRLDGRHLPAQQAALCDGRVVHRCRPRSDPGSRCVLKLSSTIQ